MADIKRCDLCGADADKVISIEFPYRDRWMGFFKKTGVNNCADVCYECIKEIRRIRQEQIKASEVSFEVTERSE